MARPVASTSVVINGADTNAGSTLNRWTTSGMSEPIVLAHVQIARIASATTAESCVPLPQSSARPKAITPRVTPSSSPLQNSRMTTRIVSRTRISLSASPRIIVGAPMFPREDLFLIKRSNSAPRQAVCRFGPHWYCAYQEAR